mmetsp:Transcript_40314/g.72629  ORF Transcript_40314/g.72629 Transcript_40314/m.72629 type:complete len:313 (+) Transcript_40314:1755-2693(+)
MPQQPRTYRSYQTHPCPFFLWVWEVHHPSFHQTPKNRQQRLSLPPLILQWDHPTDHQDCQPRSHRPSEIFPRPIPDRRGYDRYWRGGHPPRAVRRRVSIGFPRTLPRRFFSRFGCNGRRRSSDRQSPPRRNPAHPCSHAPPCCLARQTHWQRNHDPRRSHGRRTLLEPERARPCSRDREGCREVPGGGCRRPRPRSRIRACGRLIDSWVWGVRGDGQGDAVRGLRRPIFLRRRRCPSTQDPAPPWKQPHSPPTPTHTRELPHHPSHATTVTFPSYNESPWRHSDPRSLHFSPQDCRGHAPTTTLHRSPIECG